MEYLFYYRYTTTIMEKGQKWIYLCLVKKPRGEASFADTLPHERQLGCERPSEDKSILAQISEFPESELIWLELALSCPFPL
jgi:hypothetical protein